MSFMYRQSRFIFLLAFVNGLIGMAAPPARAHFGGFIVQLQDNYVVVGQDNEVTGQTPHWDIQAVGSLLSPQYYSDLPSFLSLASAPAGTQPLPTNTNIYWDFLPMTTNGYTSNLLYWDGLGTTTADVEFGPVPIPLGATDVTLGIYNTTDGSQGVVSDTPDMIAGSLLGVTNSGGSGLRLHRHNYFLLDDGDGVAPTNVAEGVYLMALQLRIPGYGTSQPIFVVPGTYELIDDSIESLEAAVAWVNQNKSVLIRTGDYDLDGDVDAADYDTWKKQFGSNGPYPIDGDYADGNRDTIVNASDYVLWRKFSSEDAAGSGGVVPAPEPAALSLVMLLVGLIGCTRRSAAQNIFG